MDGSVADSGSENVVRKGVDKLRRYITKEAFIQYLHEAQEAKTVYIGIDPGAKTCGIFVLVDGCYFSYTENLVGRKSLTGQLGSAVECGKMIGQALARDTTLEYLLGWLSLLHWVKEVHVAIEDTPRVGAFGGYEVSIPASSYWASALACWCSSKGMKVSSANSSSVKANVGLAKTGNHRENKFRALSLVKDRLGLAVQTDHEADAFLCLAHSFFPRLSSNPRSTRRVRDPLKVKQLIDEYLDGFWSFLEVTSGPQRRNSSSSSDES